jgi:hypothetical protein
MQIEGVGAEFVVLLPTQAKVAKIRIEVAGIRLGGI